MHIVAQDKAYLEKSLSSALSNTTETEVLEAARRENAALKSQINKNDSEHKQLVDDLKAEIRLARQQVQSMQGKLEEMEVVERESQEMVTRPSWLF